MSWTAPSDHAASVVSATEWNNFHGAAGNCKYLKDAVDSNAAAIASPMKAQGDGGAVRGGREKINFISGSNVTVTVADDPGGDRINVTLAAGGSSLPTDGTQKSGLVTLNDPGSGYPAWGAWTEIFAAISGPTLYVVVAFPFTTRLQLGLGATPTLVIDFDETGISSDTTKILPFRLENGARLSGRSYFTGTSARKIAVTIFT